MHPSKIDSWPSPESLFQMSYPSWLASTTHLLKLLPHRFLGNKGTEIFWPGLFIIIVVVCCVLYYDTIRFHTARIEVKQGMLVPVCLYISISTHFILSPWFPWSWRTAAYVDRTMPQHLADWLWWQAPFKRDGGGKCVSPKCMNSFFSIPARRITSLEHGIQLVVIGHCPFWSSCKIAVRGIFQRIFSRRRKQGHEAHDIGLLPGLVDRLAAILESMTIWPSSVPWCRNRPGRCNRQIRTGPGKFQGFAAGRWVGGVFHFLHRQEFPVDRLAPEVSTAKRGSSITPDYGHFQDGAQHTHQRGGPLAVVLFPPQKFRIFDKSPSTRLTG